ncbi:hypothetical protein RHMOL_Rhmol09G0049400 [Rhododendron molle]|uniref:Uncharacterized protein n=2 Tax=Rhododendron molle TaxID=49168 RepID=A0ACC0M9W6_RHOML|nr:hypothetical protein RHMOL_Rhmol09G0049400 [Rhododendron molle]KAI8537756.1 hypothetical protein RHMOL_Rhmol09G0049400 [Rhododendron molle]
MMAEKEEPKYLAFDNFQSYAGLTYTADPSSFGTVEAPQHITRDPATLIIKTRPPGGGSLDAIPSQQKPFIITLTRLFNETSEALGGSRANPDKKREIEDNSREIGALFAKLNSGDISKNAAEKLVQLCQLLDNGDFSTALQIQVQLTTSVWDECNFWLATLKQLISTD